MPPVRVLYYREDDGTIPVLDFLDGIPDRARVKLIVRIERLAELGPALRRPEADYLRDGIYELRARLGRVNYRLLYFFHSGLVAVLAAGLTKADEVPPLAIERAKARKAKFARDPGRHGYP